MTGFSEWLPAHPSSAEEAKAAVLERLNRFKRVGVLIDDVPDAALRLANELYARQHLPGWWVVCPDQATGVAALEGLTEPSPVSCSWLAVVDRMLPGGEPGFAARARDWRVGSSALRTEADRIRCIAPDRLVLITSHPVLDTDEARGGAAAAFRFEERVELPVRRQVASLSDQNILCSYLPDKEQRRFGDVMEGKARVLVAGPSCATWLEGAGWKERVRGMHDDASLTAEVDGSTGVGPSRKWHDAQTWRGGGYASERKRRATLGDIVARRDRRTTPVHVDAASVFDLIVVTTPDHYFQRAAGALQRAGARAATVVSVVGDGFWRAELGRERFLKEVVIVVSDPDRDLAVARDVKGKLNGEIIELGSGAPPLAHLVFDLRRLEGDAQGALRTPSSEGGRRVFISHAEGTLGDAVTLAGQLRGAGLWAFVDRLALGGGDSIPDELRAELNLRTDVLVILVPPDDTGWTPWQYWEISEARKAGVPVVPVFVRGARLAHIPLPFQGILGVEASELVKALEPLGLTASASGSSTSRSPARS